MEKHGDWDRLEDLGMDRKIILKRILKWVEGRGLFYIAEGRNTVMNLQVRKMQEIFWLAEENEQLLSDELHFLLNTTRKP